MPNSQQNVTNIPSNRVDFIDPRTGLVSREWYRFFVNLFNLSGAGGNQTSLDDLQVGPPPQPVSESGGGGGAGTVTSVDVSGGTTGLTTSGGPITSSGTITLAGTLNVSNGGTGATTAAGAPFALKGANADITSMSGLTGAVGSPTSLQMGNGSGTTLAEGKMWYDQTTGTWNLGMGGGNITQQVGEELYIYGKASAAITEGQLICKTGTVGASGVITFAPSPTGLTVNDGIIGVATENIAHNAFGRITQFGVVHGITTTGASVGETWADNDTLYYNPNYVGGLTNVKPTAPNIKFEIATVINAGSGGSGSIQVLLQPGSTLGGTDSNVQFGTLANNDLIAYDSGLGYWKNIPGSSYGTGSVTSVGTSGTVNGLTLTGGPITTTGTITLDGTLDLSSPPAIGGTTPAAGTFTTLTATGQTDLGGPSSNPVFRVNALSSAIQYIDIFGSTTGTTLLRSWSTNGSSSGLNFQTRGSVGFSFQTGGSTLDQLRVSHTASAVNYVQVTGAATGGSSVISAQGSDTNTGLQLRSKGTGDINLMTAGGTNQVVIRNTASAVNFISLSGSATGFAERMYAEGSDTNIALAFQSKGTGAIDLAAGSRGVNISNGGTVTAITRTAAGSGYTSFPTWAASAPTTAGGSTASGTPASMTASGYTVNSGGTGYTVGDVLTVTGGTGGNCTLTVTAVSAGAVTTATLATTLSYTVLPTNPVSVTGGTGSGATFNLSYGIGNSLTITNAGSGYVEQPTVTFSGGGGSGAAAYATVGSDTTIKSIGTNLFLSHPNGVGLQVRDNGQTACYPLFQSSGTTIQTYASSSGSNVGFQWATKGTSAHAFATNASVANIQMQVTHTASAVNYVQVTGAATGSRPYIQAQGSDTNVDLRLGAKGSGGVYSTAFFVAGAQLFNNVLIQGAATGSSPYIQASGGDTNIDLTLTPKGTGNVRFGTYTAGALAIAGYIEIKDSGGTVRKLAVVA